MKKLFTLGAESNAEQSIWLILLDEFSLEIPPSDSELAYRSSRVCGLFKNFSWYMNTPSPTKKTKKISKTK